MPANFAKTISSLIDLTSLNASDTQESIIALSKKAVSPLGQVAAVCVFPQFIAVVRNQLRNNSLGLGSKHTDHQHFDACVKIATVANFPSGNEPLAQVLAGIKQSLQDGADEIDLVFPYQAYLQGEKNFALDFLHSCRAVCNRTLKVILETGAFPSPELIEQASQDILLIGADFIKTSTGKLPVGATLPAAEAMLSAIHKLTPTCSPRVLGFKASGGVRTLEQARHYYTLASKVMGEAWISPQTFRIGASQFSG